MAVDIIGRQRLLEPADVELLITARPPDRLIDSESLVGIGEDLEGLPDGLPYSTDPCDILMQGPPQFQLRAAETGLLLP
jgi:hypothetical protein